MPQLENNLPSSLLAKCRRTKATLEPNHPLGRTTRHQAFQATQNLLQAPAKRTVMVRLQKPQHRTMDSRIIQKKRTLPQEAAKGKAIIMTIQNLPHNAAKSQTITMTTQNLLRKTVHIITIH